MKTITCVKIESTRDIYSVELNYNKNDEYKIFRSMCKELNCNLFEIVYSELLSKNLVMVVDEEFLYRKNLVNVYGTWLNGGIQNLVLGDILICYQVETPDGYIIEDMPDEVYQHLMLYLHSQGDLMNRLALEIENYLNESYKD